MNSLLLKNARILNNDTNSSEMLSDILILHGEIKLIQRHIGLERGKVIDVKGNLVLPGLINAHSHSIEMLGRGLRDAIPLEYWLSNLDIGNGLTPEKFYHIAQWHGVQLLKTGTTCIVDHFYANDNNFECMIAAMEGYQSVGIRAFVLPLYSDIPADELFHQALGIARTDSTHLQVTSNLIKRLEQMLLKLTQLNFATVRIGLGPGSPQSCSDPLLKATAALSKEYNLIVQTHFLETPIQRLLEDNSQTGRFLEKLDRAALLDRCLSLAHCIWVNDLDISTIIKSGITIVHNPSSNLRFGSGIAPIINYYRRGGKIGLGTDGIGTDGTPNLLSELRLATLLHRLTTLDFDEWIPAKLAFNFATNGGASVVGLDKILGRVKEGYKADLIIVDTETPTYHPKNNLLNQFVLCESGASIDTVIVEGKLVIEDKHLIAFDENKIYQNIKSIGSRKAIFSSEDVPEIVQKIYNKAKFMYSTKTVNNS